MDVMAGGTLSFTQLRARTTAVDTILALWSAHHFGVSADPGKLNE